MPDLYSKAEAAADVVAYNTSLIFRVNQFLKAQAANGQVGGVYAYGTEPAARAIQVTNILNGPNGGGWVAVHDGGAKTITIT